MSKYETPMDLLSKKRENIFDDYYNLIEASKLDQLKKGSHEEHIDFEIATIALTILERNIEDLAINKNTIEKQFKEINESVLKCLKEWLGIFEVLITQPLFIISFSYNIIGLSVLVAQINELGLLDVLKDIIFFSPSRKDRIRYEKAISESSIEIPNPVEGSNYGRVVDEIISPLWNRVFSAYNKESSLKRIVGDLENILSSVKHELQNREITEESSYSINNTLHFALKGEYLPLLANKIYNNYKINIFPFIDINTVKELDDTEIDKYRDFINNKDVHIIIEKIRNDYEYTFEWDITINFPEGPFNATQISYLMWTLSYSLSSIDGVEVIVDDWGIGSRWVKIKAIIRDFLAKEEVKQVLDKGRKGAEAKYFEKPIEETGKLRAEKVKTEREADTIMSREDSEELHKLELEKKRLENREKEIEIESKAADVAFKKLQFIRGVSDMISDGIIKNDSNFQMMVNDLLYVNKSNQTLTIGEHIDLIEEKEIRNETQSEDLSERDTAS